MNVKGIPNRIRNSQAYPLTKNCHRIEEIMPIHAIIRIRKQSLLTMYVVRM